jgi:hypothetical protein
LVLDLEGVNFIDSQGSEQLGAILELLESNRVALRLARVKPSVQAVLRADGFVERLGAARIHGNVHRAVEAALADEGAGAPASKNAGWQSAST